MNFMIYHDVKFCREGIILFSRVSYTYFGFYFVAGAEQYPPKQGKTNRGPVARLDNFHLRNNRIKIMISISCKFNCAVLFSHDVHINKIKLCLITILD